MCVLIESIVTPPATRLRLLLLVCVSFGNSFQFFTRFAAVFAEEVGDCHRTIQKRDEERVYRADTMFRCHKKIL